MKYFVTAWFLSLVGSLALVPVLASWCFSAVVIAVGLAFFVGLVLGIVACEALIGLPAIRSGMALQALQAGRSRKGFHPSHPAIFSGRAND